MNDRSLLELAAKAAGYTVHGSVDRFFYVNFGEGVRGPWDPINDDGEAMRLAVDLGIEIHPDNTCAETSTAFMIGNFGYNTFEEWAKYGGDKHSATRLAIVRAAAEIGKAMP